MTLVDKFNELDDLLKDDNFIKETEEYIKNIKKDDILGYCEINNWTGHKYFIFSRVKNITPKGRIRLVSGELIDPNDIISRWCDYKKLKYFKPIDAFMVYNQLYMDSKKKLNHVLDKSDMASLMEVDINKLNRIYLILSEESDNNKEEITWRSLKREIK